MGFTVSPFTWYRPPQRSLLSLLQRDLRHGCPPANRSTEPGDSGLQRGCGHRAGGPRKPRPHSRRQFDAFEILVVDDGSADDTARVVERLLPTARHTRLLRHATNRGYGAALRTGFEAARFGLVAFTDADCQFDLTDWARSRHWRPSTRSSRAIGPIARTRGGGGSSRGATTGSRGHFSARGSATSIARSRCFAAMCWRSSCRHRAASS